MASLEAHYAASDIEARLLAALRAAGLNPEQPIKAEDLGSFDHFHTGGLPASRALMERARIQARDRVLDIGAGLAGAARMLVAAHGCRVDCIDMVPDFCSGARLLNRLTGLEEKITVHQGSALALPFPDDAFDLVWMQNVGMNIAEKDRLYSEIFRVLRPGGRYAFQEMVAGSGTITDFPLPWASEPADSNLITTAAFRALLEARGFKTTVFEDTSDEHLNTTTLNAPPTPLTLGVYVDNLGLKAANARRALEAGKIRFVRGVFQK